MENIKSCKFCSSAFTIPELDFFNDFSAFSVGKSLEGYRILYESGCKVSPFLSFSHWDKSSMSWIPVARYYPKYCPECGRKIFERDDKKCI